MPVCVLEVTHTARYVEGLEERLGEMEYVQPVVLAQSYSPTNVHTGMVVC